MARRIQRKALRKPDEFVDLGSRTLNWIADHRGALGIAIAAVLVVVFGVMLVIHLRRNANVEEWRGVLGAVPVREMPKGEEPGLEQIIGKQDPAVWVDDAKLKAAAEHADSDAVRRLADLPLAGELLAQGDAAGAEQRYRAYLKGDPANTSAGRLIAQEGLGYALERQNKLDEAAKAFAALADLSGGAYKALALYQQGRLAAQAGHDEDARKLLEEAKAIPDPRPSDVGPQIESWLRLLDMRRPAPAPDSAPEPAEPTAPAAAPVAAAADAAPSPSPDATTAPEQPAPAAAADATQADAPAALP